MLLVLIPEANLSRAQVVSGTASVQLLGPFPSRSSVNVGENFSVSCVVLNNGTSPAFDITVTLYIPVIPGGPDSPAASGGPYTIPVLNPGDRMNFNFTLDPRDPGRYQIGIALVVAGYIIKSQVVEVTAIGATQPTVLDASSANRAEILTIFSLVVVGIFGIGRVRTPLWKEVNRHRLFSITTSVLIITIFLSPYLPFHSASGVLEAAIGVATWLTVPFFSLGMPILAGLYGYKTRAQLAAFIIPFMTLLALETIIQLTIALPVLYPDFTMHMSLILALGLIGVGFARIKKSFPSALAITVGSLAVWCYVMVPSLLRFLISPT